jgi:L-ribulokinase
MQIYADVLRRPIQIAAEENASAFGAGMHAAVAAGIYPNLRSAAAKMTRKPARVYKPRKGEESIYDTVYAEYVKVHDFFGREQAQTMKTLSNLAKELRR